MRSCEPKENIRSPLGSQEILHLNNRILRQILFFVNFIGRMKAARPISSGKDIFLPRCCRRSLHWERGLKPVKLRSILHDKGRSLHWERGLKQSMRLSMLQAQIVAPFIGRARQTGDLRDN